MTAIRLLLRLGRDEGAATLATTALLLTVLLGFVGLGLDLGAQYTTRRVAQNAADSAALTAAVALQSGAKDVSAEANAVAAQYGAGGATVQVNTPPTLGSYTSDSNAVEVIVTQPAVGFFSTLFAVNAQPIRARAVAKLGAPSGCLTALDGGSTTIVNGSVTLNMPTCALYVNSKANPGLTVNGGDVLNTAGVYVAGTALSNGATFSPGALHLGATPVDDPYANVKLNLGGPPPPPGPGGPAPPPPGNCNSTSVVSGSTANFSANGQAPFVFCGGLTINSGSVAFGPGTYVFNGALIVNQSQLTGTGVTFVFNGTAGPTFNSGGSVTLTAPTSGAGAGLLFYGPTVTAATVNAAANEKFEGSLYFPKAVMTFNGGTDFTGADCTQIIAANFILNGGLPINLACTSPGPHAGAGGAAKLVE